MNKELHKSLDTIQQELAKVRSMKRITAEDLYQAQTEFCFSGALMNEIFFPYITKGKQHEKKGEKI